MSESLDTSQIQDWRSIITLILFVLTNITVLFPFHIPIYVPQALSRRVLNSLSGLRVISPRKDDRNGGSQGFVRFNFPMNFVTAPLIADLFLLAILAIGREEVYAGTIGADGISPIDIMVFFLTLAYIAISIDASGLIRYLAFKVLQKGGETGHRLFFYLYAFFFGLATFMGNDPVILSGTAFLAYMTRVSISIKKPTAWIHTQFAIANIASAILVSSNPTNLVLSGAFNVKFINYTANMIVPVFVTAIVLFPFLLYVVFADETLIPQSIKIHELSDDLKAKKPVNPNIPNARGNAEEEENKDNEEGKKLSLEEILNPFLDKGGAAFGAVIMTTTLITLLAINASSQTGKEKPVFWVTLPAAFVMFCWDLTFGWIHRKETREIVRKGREDILAHAREEEAEKTSNTDADAHESDQIQRNHPDTRHETHTNADDEISPVQEGKEVDMSSSEEMGEKNQEVLDRAPPQAAAQGKHERMTLVLLIKKAYRWSQETFPTVTVVVAHLPFALVPFAFSMFVLVQALVTKGWVPVFAYGWDHWVSKTGTVGSIGGMAFLAVILCNFAGTNIGTTILLSRVIQAWQTIHQDNGTTITNRTFWGAVYGMAIGVNYGAFSTAFSASLAGLLWRDILARKHITVKPFDFANVNLPIISIAMAVGCAVLVAEVYIVRDDSPYNG